MRNEHRPLAAMAEDELVDRARQHDQEAFAELMHRNLPASYRLALSVLKNRQDAEDEVQSAFLKAWKALAAFQGQARFSTWFRSIVFNQSLMRLRSLRRANLRSLDDTDGEGATFEVRDTRADAETLLGDGEMRARLRAEVERLPKLMRDVLVLRDLEHLSTEDAAARLGLTESAVKSRLTRARAMLRERMQRHVQRYSMVF